MPNTYDFNIFTSLANDRVRSILKKSTFSRFKLNFEKNRIFRISRNRSIARLLKMLKSYVYHLIFMCIHRALLLLGACISRVPRLVLQFRLHQQKFSQRLFFSSGCKRHQWRRHISRLPFEPLLLAKRPKSDLLRN